MKRPTIKRFNSMASVLAWCYESHGGMINLDKFKKINDNIAKLGELNEHAGLHIPYVEQGVKRYIMPVIEQGRVQHIIPDDNRSYIHLVDAGCLTEARIYRKNEEEGVQLIDHSVYFKLSPNGHQKTTMKLQSTIKDVIVKGEKHSVWVKAELLDENS